MKLSKKFDGLLPKTLSTCKSNNLAIYHQGALCDTLHHSMLWTIYLNEEFSEGETEFLYQYKK